MKYMKLFENYKDTDFETDDKESMFAVGTGEGGKSTTGKFTGKLTPDDQSLLDELKNMFGDESFKGISSSDAGAIVGSGAGKRNVDYITFKFAFYGNKESGDTMILYVSVNKNTNSCSVSIEHPNNQDNSISKDFKTNGELVNFLKTLGRLKRYIKN